jgi:hypothetical protein
MASHSRGAIPSGLCKLDLPRRNEGAGKAGCRLHPWVPCNKKHGGRTTGETGSNPASPARCLTTYSVLSQVCRAL